MQIFVNSMNKYSATYHLLANDNQLEKFSHRLLANDNQTKNFNEICERSKVVNGNNNDSHESKNNNELNDNLNDEDESMC